MSDLKRNLQYLKSLKEQREQKRTRLTELDAQIAHLRKNPSDKLTNDLLLYSNNKKKEILKEEISSIDKEIYKLNASIENDCEELDQLSDLDIEEYSAELNEIFPEPETEIQLESEPIECEQEAGPSEEVQPLTPKKEPGIFFKLINGYKNIPNLIVCSVISIALLWTLFVWDSANLISYFTKVTKFNFFSFLIFGVFALTVISTYAYKGITAKDFGAISDYFMLILAICSIGILGLYINASTTFKLVIFSFLAIYSLIYYALRLYLYQKNIKALSEKNRFFKYYYDLFTKISPVVLALAVTACFVLLYLTMTTRLFKRWLGSKDAHKVLIIINIILIALAYLYVSAFSIVRINESNVYAIDLFAFLSEIVAVEYFIICKFISAPASIINTVIVILTFVFALGLNIYRIIKTKK